MIVFLSTHFTAELHGGFYTPIVSADRRAVMNDNMRCVIGILTETAKFVFF